MTGGLLSTEKEKISVKHRKNQLDGVVIELSVPDCGEPTSLGKEKYNLSEAQASEKLSTRDLVSAVGYAWWNLANRPLSVSLYGKNSNLKSECGQGDSPLHYSADGGSFQISASAGGGYSSSYHTAVEKHSAVRAEEYQVFPSWRIILESCAASNGYSTLSQSPYLRNNYAWMSKLAAQVNVAQLERRLTFNYHACGFLASTRYGFTLNDSTTGMSFSRAENAQSSDLLSCKASEENSVVHRQCVEVADKDSQEANSASISKFCQDNTVNSSKCLHGNEENDQATVSGADASELEVLLPAERHYYAIARQEHAFAGAMAGICVSLCLHPIDTIKTVIQSCRADVKPLHNIFRTIITEKGVSGLYRGISSNIVSSAPISAVYTLTYETVKKSILPFFPKECCSLAHCTAGGCASIATSFIFTPSERIKQQMQVRSCYRNCWNALIQILKKGGLPSLYAGWGAVLCRNIPHSVIKFYTYESLKQILIPSFESDHRQNTVATLICGGLAGSTASLFTTPFDVVKTRLQTQVPGSVTQYSGVFTTLSEIGKQEGLRGLYRGLTPRLVMYMIQGALFFTSYESFKRLLSLE